MGEGALSEAFDVAEHLVDLGEVMSPSIALSGFLGVGPRLLRGDTEQHGTRQDVGRADRVEQQQALGGAIIEGAIPRDRTQEKSEEGKMNEGATTFVCSVIKWISSHSLTKSGGSFCNGA